MQQSIVIVIGGAQFFFLYGEGSQGHIFNTMSKIMEPNIPYIANTILTDVPVNYKIFNT